MRLGKKPRKAAEDAVLRILKYYPTYIGALIAVDTSGKHSAAAAGWKFKYAVRDASSNATQVHAVEPISFASS